MDSPSCLPSAAAIGATCFDSYRARIDAHADPELRASVERLAEHLFNAGIFRDIFIEQLVPWPSLVKLPNAGHFAIADLIATGAIRCALSANYDMLIERAAWELRADIRTAIDGPGAAAIPENTSFLLKFHGSSADRRDLTVWTPVQFALDDEVRARRDSNAEWLGNHLNDNDLLFVGFWSDWAYLNQTLEQVLGASQPRSVTLVDPEMAHVLETKAPGLWALAHGPGVVFEHVPVRGAVFLTELRVALSASIFAQLLRLGLAALQEHRPGTLVEEGHLELPQLSDEMYYLWRRDLEGMTDEQPACVLELTLNHRLVGLLHVLLRLAGATADERGYRLGARRVRVVNGNGRLMTEARVAFREPPSINEPDYVIVVGAGDLGGVPHHQIRDADPATVLRAGPGSRWVDFSTAVQELAL